MAGKPFDMERSWQRWLMLLKVHFHPNSSIHLAKCWVLLPAWGVRGPAGLFLGGEGRKAGSASSQENAGAASFLALCSGSTRTVAAGRLRWR